MKILVVSAVLPYPLYSGGQVRMYNLLKRLSKKHEITLVSFIRDETERRYSKELSFCHNIFFINRGRAWRFGYIARAMCTRLPFLLSTYTNGGMHRLLSRLLEKNTYDLIHLEPFYVWPSIPNTDIPIVVSEHNIEYEVYAEYVRRISFFPLRWILGIDIDKLKRWERYVWRKVTNLTAVSLRDQHVIEEYLSFPVSLVQNGVDTSSFVYTRQKSGGKKNILFVGNFRWVPNIEAAQWLLTDIWPRIAKQFPQSSLRIIGRNMPEHIKRQSTERVVCLSDVSDIRTEYANAFVLMAPMTIKGGTKFKVLEAMASGVPVISTKEGIEGIDCEDGKHVLLSTTSQSFVDQLVELDSNKVYMDTLTRNARKLVETDYNWDIIAKALDTVWKRAYEKKR